MSWLSCHSQNLAPPQKSTACFHKTHLSHWILRVHPQKQTWNPKMDPWKSRFLLETAIFLVPCCFWGVYLTVLKVQKVHIFCQQIFLRQVSLGPHPTPLEPDAANQSWMAAKIFRPQEQRSKTDTLICHSTILWRRLGNLNTRSGQNRISHQPRFPWWFPFNKKLPFRGPGIIWPD